MRREEKIWNPAGSAPRHLVAGPLVWPFRVAPWVRFRMLVRSHATHCAPDVLGPLLHEEVGPVRLLETLQVFVEVGGRVREAAAALCIHENTVRQRMLRIRAVTGLDLLTSTTDLLTAQAALLVLSLRGMLSCAGAADRP